ncbi:hypothetical protein [Flavobacterium aquiphilum]|uniref:hypothetical protein n=1 Tax=Flavobacterium aquiphilum TaxID=3003261 RepID=UPI00247FB5B6|nr:hypothetical protein [Flavobacterium aquiphilum]
MKYRFCNRIILLTLLVLSSFSCSSDLDYNQVNDFNIQPVFTTNLAYLEAKAPDFVENNVEQPIFGYLTNTEFLNNTFVDQDLVKAEMYFRIKNTINRAYRFNVTFLNAAGTPIYTIAMNVPAYSGTETLTEKTETFAAANIAILKNTTKLAFTIVMLPGPPLTESSPGRIELSSSVTAYFDVK